MKGIMGILLSVNCLHKSYSLLVYYTEDKEHCHQTYAYVLVKKSGEESMPKTTSKDVLPVDRLRKVAIGVATIAILATIANTWATIANNLATNLNTIATIENTQATRENTKSNRRNLNLKGRRRSRKR